MSGGRSPTPELLEQALQRAKPRLAETFDRYSISPSDASVIMAQTMTALIYRWRELSNPDLWLVQTVERRCHRRSVEGGELGQAPVAETTPEPGGSKC